jgi:hypothetical protein
MDAAWDELRRRRRAFWLTILLLPLWLVPGGMIQHVLAGFGFGAASLVTFLVVVVPPLACVGIGYLRLIFWPCPHCGSCFHVTWWYGNMFARRCVHCGLPKWTPKPKAAQTDFA